MVTRHPLVLGISLIGVLFYERTQVQRKTFFSDLGFYAVLFVLLALTNPIFVHKGSTPLFFLNGNAVTMEAIIFGGVMGVLLICLLYWSKAVSRVFSSDKVVYLLGNIVPKLALVISMALHFISELMEEYQDIRGVQSTYLGFQKTWRKRIKIELLCFEALIAYALENSVEKAISMRSRGYGVQKRSFYSIYRFQKRDFILSGWSVFCFIVFVIMFYFGSFDMQYYPKLEEMTIDTQTVLALIMLFCLTSFAGILEVKESLQWNYLRSKI